jgi:hypothetical protein
MPSNNYFNYSYPGLNSGGGVGGFGGSTANPWSWSGGQQANQNGGQFNSGALNSWSPSPIEQTNPSGMDWSGLLGGLFGMGGMFGQPNSFGPQSPYVPPSSFGPQNPAYRPPGSTPYQTTPQPITGGFGPYPTGPYEPGTSYTGDPNSQSLYNMGWNPSNPTPTSGPTGYSTGSVPASGYTGSTPTAPTGTDPSLAGFQSWGQSGGAPTLLAPQTASFLGYGSPPPGSKGFNPNTGQWE